jgi:hypothetical protein
MEELSKKLFRCAIYTRKSTEHNLDLEFNSLDAQREACEAYIRSQAHEGWRLIPARYDDGTFSGAGREPGGGLVVLPDAFTGAHRASIILAAAQNNVPAVYSQSAYARDGGLLSYRVDQVDNYRRAASYVDRILRGAKPGDLPVQFPTKFEMAVNLKTARGARPCRTPIDHAARHRGDRITAGYVGLWH